MQRALVVDDNAFQRNGISDYLSTRGYAVQQATNAQSAWEKALSQPPTLAVLDILIHDRQDISDTIPPREPHGIALAQRLKEAYPTMGILIMSSHPEFEQEVLRLTEKNLRGIAFLHKTGPSNRVEVALREVEAGRNLYQTDLPSPYVLETFVRQHFHDDETYWVDQALLGFETLTPRELEIANMVANSFNSDAIAELVNLSKGTVDNIISNIYAKLGLSNIRQQSRHLRPLAILIKACMLYDIRSNH